MLAVCRRCAVCAVCFVAGVAEGSRFDAMRLLSRVDGNPEGPSGAVSSAENINDAIDEMFDDALGEQVMHAEEAHESFQSGSHVQSRCDRVRPQQLELPRDTAEVIFVRHGLSLNNVFTEHLSHNIRGVAGGLVGNAVWKNTSVSRFKRGYVEVCLKDGLCGDYSDGVASNSPESLRWELGGQSRDCLLHPEGQAGALLLQKILSEVLPPDLPISGFYSSPLRRTLQTMLSAFGCAVDRHPWAAVAVQPWLHERYKSEGDLAHDGPVTAKFLKKYASYMSRSKPVGRALTSGVQELEDQLVSLGDWVRTEGDPHPKSLHVEPLPANSSGQAFPFYPGVVGTMRESSTQLKQRMVILRRWLKHLPPGRRYVLVAHGGISKGLFQHFSPEGASKLGNLGILVAQFKPHIADAEDPVGFWSDVQVARDKWSCPLLPGWDVSEQMDPFERLLSVSNPPTFTHACPTEHHYPQVDSMLCNVTNSNGIDGPDCACANGFQGSITWQGHTASGVCTPAPCSVSNSNALPGLACACNEGFVGKIAWTGDVVRGSCEEAPVEAATLFAQTGFFELGSKRFKCCVHSSNEGPPIVQDITAMPLPNQRDFCLDTSACGCMFGNSWHSSQKSGNTCLVQISYLSSVTEVSVSALTRMLAPCDVENSNGKLGDQCACGDGFNGTIEWSSEMKRYVGVCTPARCQVPKSNGQPGWACACAKGFSGHIRWAGARPLGSCEEATVDAGVLFRPYLTTGRHHYKCCVHSKGLLSPIVQDVTAPTLPRRRVLCSVPSGCGCMFGDGWHSSNVEFGKDQVPCNVRIGYLSEVSGLSTERLSLEIDEAWLAKDGVAPYASS